MNEPLISANELLEFEKRTETINSIILTLAEGFEANAKVLSAKKQALLNNGFSEEEAIEIIKSRNLFDL